MTDAQRIDGDDMTWDWHQTLSSTGSLGGSYFDSSSEDTQTLYGTMHNGDVAGLSLVDVPPSYVVQTHAQRTDNALWHLSVRIAELADELRNVRSELATVQQQLANMTADS